MRLSIGAAGFTAEAEVFADGTMTLILVNVDGRAVAKGRWIPDEEPEQPDIRPADAWPPGDGRRERASA